MRGVNLAAAALVVLLGCGNFGAAVAQNGAKRVNNDAGFSVEPTNAPSASPARLSGSRRDPPAGFPFRDAKEAKAKTESTVIGTVPISV